MSSRRKILSNRRNSLQSTGPRTPAGKARSSLNALRHGLRSGTIAVLPSEYREANDFVRETWAGLAPVGPQEGILAELIIGKMIRVRRANTIEVGLLRRSTPESMYDLVEKIAANEGLTYVAAAKQALSVKRIVSGKTTASSAAKRDESEPPPEEFDAGAVSDSKEVAEPPDSGASQQAYSEQGDGSTDEQAAVEADMSETDCPIRVVTPGETDNSELERIAENSAMNERPLALVYRCRTAGINRVRKLLRELDNIQRARYESDSSEGMDLDEKEERDTGDLLEEIG